MQCTDNSPIENGTDLFVFELSMWTYQLVWQPMTPLHRLTHLAMGHPWGLFPSFPVYLTFSILNAGPMILNLEERRQKHCKYCSWCDIPLNSQCSPPNLRIIKIKKKWVRTIIKPRFFAEKQHQKTTSTTTSLHFGGNYIILVHWKRFVCCYNLGPKIWCQWNKNKK